MFHLILMILRSATQMYLNFLMILHFHANQMFH
jgi:hypothetical protein